MPRSWKTTGRPSCATMIRVPAKMGEDSGEMLGRFLQEKRMGQGAGDPLSLDYIEGAREISQGLIRDQREQARGMFDFCLWFSRQSATSSGEEEKP